MLEAQGGKRVSGSRTICGRSSCRRLSCCCCASTRRGREKIVSCAGLSRTRVVGLEGRHERDGSSVLREGSVRGRQSRPPSDTWLSCRGAKGYKTGEWGLGPG